MPVWNPLSRPAARNPALTVEKLAAATNRSVADLRNEIARKIALNHHLNATQNSGDYEAYVARERERADGTELRIKHIVLRPLRAGTAEELLALVTQAGELRSAILAGKLSFDEAAAKHSVGPSHTDHGDLGWIRADGPMMDTFTQAAFALRKDDGSEISPPIVTPYGVHLLTCVGVKPGTRSQSELRERLRGDYAEFRARALVAELRRKANIVYAPGTPRVRIESPADAPKP
ncbi:MAG: peptidylprolyl isomerase [Pirellulales bacterium]